MFDRSKDERIHVAPPVEGDRESSILIGVFRYDGGPPRARLKRAKHLRTGQTIETGIGGMSRREILEVAKCLVSLAANDSAWGIP